jgi:hypothetical protein
MLSNPSLVDGKGVGSSTWFFGHLREFNLQKFGISQHSPSILYKLYQWRGRFPGCGQSGKIEGVSTGSTFSSPKSPTAQNWRLFFWGQSLRIVSNAFSPISPTAINKIEWLSIVFIQLRSLIFVVSPLNIQFLKGEVIPATRLRHARSIGTFHTWSSNSSRSVMKITIMLHGNYSKHFVVQISNINVFVFFYIRGLHISAITLSDFRSPSRARRMVSFSLHCIWCLCWLNTSDVP